MKFSLSSNWSIARHREGESLVDEALALGFDALELGYHTTEKIAEGVRNRLKTGAIEVWSVHAFCPVPIGAPHGYPELYLMASLDDDERALAKHWVEQTLEFATTVDAKAVVLHAGRIYLRSIFGSLSTDSLVYALEDADDQPQAPAVVRVTRRIKERRARRVRKIYDAFCLSLDTLLPKFERAGITLCLENLPSVEAFPDEDEMIMLKERFPTPALAQWYDLGHGQLRENLGLINNVAAAQRLLPFTRGIHIHDALPLMRDHLPPGKGEIDFKGLSFYGADNIIRVFEPSPKVSHEDLLTALQFVRNAWEK